MKKQIIINKIKKKKHLSQKNTHTFLCNFGRRKKTMQTKNYLKNQSN